MRGQAVDLWVSDYACVDAPEAVFLGNGETREKAGLIFGERLAGRLWEISQANLQLARKLFTESRVEFTETEGALIFSPGRLAAALAEPFQTFSTLEHLEQKGNAEVRAHLKTAEGTKQVAAPLAVIATEAYGLSTIALLSDKRIPTTLSSFCFTDVKKQAGYQLFNQGADFTISNGSELRLGSFRNLYADRGVGLRNEIDPVTQKNLLNFFSAKGVVSANATARPVRRIESLSCDGIPLVGTFAGLPGAVFATGFAARSAAFLFAVAESVAATVLGEAAQDLAIFSPRRLL